MATGATCLYTRWTALGDVPGGAMPSRGDARCGREQSTNPTAPSPRLLCSLAAHPYTCDGVPLVEV